VNPTVSIILPTYQRLAYLQEAVESVRAQTIDGWELLVIDDGSTDGSADWIDSLGDARVRVVRQPHTGHRSVLRNIGLKQSRGEWIAFIDSDDRWEPDKLERQLAYHAANPDVEWSYTGRSVIDGDGKVRPDHLFKPWRPIGGWIVRHVLELEAMIGLPSVIVRKSLLTAVGGFDETRRWAEDYDLWLRLARRAPCGVLDAPLTVIRTHRSTSFDRPEVDQGFMSAYRSFALTTEDEELRRRAKRREGYYAVFAADKWTNRREWKKALSALAVAVRRTPDDRRIPRSALRFVWRFLSAGGRSSAPAA
jgi:glycosyltransferase involved in cell wall biosynthesis